MVLHTITTTGHPLRGSTLRSQSGRTAFVLVLTDALEQGNITKQLALLQGRNKSGDCIRGTTRYKETLAAKGQLKCNLCNLKSGDQYGHTGMCLTVKHFDVDGLTKEHEKVGGGASRKIGVTEKEVNNGVAQMLCKFCHTTKNFAP